MQEKVQGQLARSATGRQVAIFFAGSDPLNSVYRLLADWLDARRIEYASVDIDEDPALACLKQKELLEAVLPILCVAGHVAAGPGPGAAAGARAGAAGGQFLPPPTLPVNRHLIIIIEWYMYILPDKTL